MAGEMRTALKSALQVYTVRFRPGEELKSGLLKFVKDNNLRAAFVMTCVGSVSKASLRMASKDGKSKTEEVKTYDEWFEILSLVGTLSGERGHLHISLGRKDGSVIGGHVMGDHIVYTTAEVVIGECVDVAYDREQDQATGYPELTVKERKE